MGQNNHEHEVLTAKYLELKGILNDLEVELCGEHDIRFNQLKDAIGKFGEDFIDHKENTVHLDNLELSVTIAKWVGGILVGMAGIASAIASFIM